jgi:hypothetical protein
MEIKPLKIQLPEEIEKLTEGSLFDNDGLISDDMLSKYLAYNPEIIRIYGLAMADLKKKQRELEVEIMKEEKKLKRIKARIILKLDPGIYKNESMRDAKVYMDQEYQAVEDSIDNLQSDLVQLKSAIDQVSESYWKHKNMGASLDSMTRIRLSERRY